MGKRGDLIEFMNSKALPHSISEALVRKCGSIVSLSIAWERSIRTALASGASESAIVTLLDAFKSSRTLDVLALGLGEGTGGIDGFLSHLRVLVDESAFDLASWLSAFEVVQSYLVGEGRRASSSSIVGYVHCSAEFGSGPENRESLPELISDMLARYGFEGQDGCSTGYSG